MAEVTESLAKKYAEWTHAELVQEIADAMESLTQLRDDLETAQGKTEKAEEDADRAAAAAEEAEVERDTAIGERTALEDEVRWAEGMKRPEAPALRRALETVQGKHPHTMTPLLVD